MVPPQETGSLPISNETEVSPAVEEVPNPSISKSPLKAKKNTKRKSKKSSNSSSSNKSKNSSVASSESSSSKSSGSTKSSKSKSKITTAKKQLKEVTKKRSKTRVSKKVVNTIIIKKVKQNPHPEPEPELEPVVKRVRKIRKRTPVAKKTTTVTVIVRRLNKETGQIEEVKEEVEKPIDQPEDIPKEETDRVIEEQCSNIAKEEQEKEKELIYDGPVDNVLVEVITSEIIAESERMCCSIDDILDKRMIGPKLRAAIIDYQEKMSSVLIEMKKPAPLKQFSRSFGIKETKRL